jgi:hypothetical protein
MPLPGKMALTLAVVAGGIALGTVLGTAANPTMKMRAERPWQGALEAPVAADPGYRLTIEAPPEDLSPYQDSYAPTWAHEELANWEPDYPAWSYSDLADETSANPSVTEEPHLDELPIAIDTPPSEAAPQPAGDVALASQQRVAGNLAALY